MNLPINAFYWIIAILPILLLLILMVILQWGASKAAPVALIFSIISGVFLFKAGALVIFIELLKALWSSLSIILVILTAILLYEVSNESKSLNVLNKAFKKIAPNELLRIMAIGIVFASFLQGVTGFGVPVLVTAPLLIGIGVAPLWAVIIPLIGHSWAGTFGTLALAWNSLILQTGIIDTGSISSIAVYATVLLFILNIIASSTICFFYGGFKAFKKGFIAILALSLTQGLGQIMFSKIIPDLAVFIPSSLSLIALVILSKTRLYKEPWKINESKVMIRKDLLEVEEISNMTTNEAFMPYYLMTIITLSILLITPINKFLSKVSFGPSFIQTRTGFGVINEMVKGFSPLKPFTHASIFLLAASIGTYIYYRRKHLIKKGSINNILKRVSKKAIPSSLAIITLIAMSRVMSGTGQTDVLAQGVSKVLANNYAFIAPFIGLLGSFMTGSNMSSNILFGSFQMKTAEIVGLNSFSVLGVQTAGAAIGTSVAPGNIVLGTTTAGIIGSEGKVLKIIIPFALGVATLFGILMLIFQKFLV